MNSIIRIACISVISALALSCAEKPKNAAVIIPQPAKTINTEGTFTFTDKTAVFFEKTGSHEQGAYTLEITPKRINITSATEEGMFYGMQSLRQLQDIYGKNIPCAVIEDSPRFRSRGLLLDASRHFLPTDFIKKQLDMMAYLKMNCFIWYLAGDGGWRLEVDTYPQLTAETAWRSVADYTAWKEAGGKFCSADSPGAYGGYYTKEDVADVLEYAGKRFITVIPAMDLPCAHNKISSVLGIECRTGTDGREEESEAIKDILSSVIEMFHPTHVYLGDGKADQSRGAFCMECQPRIERGKTGNILDSRYGYVLQQAENFMLANGVKLMAWDESLRGVLSEDAAVISWNKAGEGLAAAEMAYDVILSPSAYSSLDYYQADPTSGPVSSPGYLPLSKVYNYDPVPYDFPEEYGEYIMGIQANLWTPHITGTENAEYMLYPRLLAVAEAAWTHPEMKSYTNFRSRAENLAKVLRKKGYNCYDTRNAVTDRPEYSQPVKHLAWDKEVIYITQPNRQFPGSGITALTDGQRGGWSFDDGRWQGFRSIDLDVVIDLGSTTEIHSVSADFLQDYAGRIWMPEEVDIRISDDGENFRLLTTAKNSVPPDRKIFTISSFGWKGMAETRYVRCTARNNGRTGGWLFTDEIIIE